MKNYIIGNVRKIIYESNNGPYKIGLFRVKETNDEEAELYIDKVIGFTGNFNDINLDLEYILYGKMYNHPKYGIQYNVETYELKSPTDTDSLILYLSSGMFKGIGEKTAKKIVERFGMDTINIIKNDYYKLATISGMSELKAKNMHDKIIDNELNQDMIIKLNGYGFSVKEAIDLLTLFGSRLEGIIENDIYELVTNINFDKLDLIFLKNNDEQDSRRIEALIKHNIYNMCYETGDTLIQKEELFIRMKKCFNKDFDSNKYIVHLNKLIESNDIVLYKDLVTLHDVFYTEKNILTYINRINDIKDTIKDEKIEEHITQYEKENNIKFNEEQKDAIKGSLKNNFYIITGGPGTGKTTIIKAIVSIIKNIYKIRDNDIALLAPTGRSAKRMMESVNAPAYTIHKFLKWNKETGSFQMNEFNKVNEKIIIVDEASMIDIFLMSSLLNALKFNVKLLLIGDANQLPSIGPGDVLNDLLKLDNVKSKCLNKIYRVKEGSYITYLANDIKNKKYFDKFDSYSDFRFIQSNDENIMTYISEVCSKVKEKNISIENFQVLAPMYKGQCGIDNINKLMSNIFNDRSDKVQIADKYYGINDKVIQLVNDVENNVFNGDIGYIKSIRYIDKKLYISIDYMNNIVTYKSGEFDKFTLAYAISIHKSQGSEYDNVVVVLAKGFRRMLYNKLIYTAVTRAKSSLIIIGNIESLNLSVQTLYACNRVTYLKNV